MQKKTKHVSKSSIKRAKKPKAKKTLIKRPVGRPQFAVNKKTRDKVERLIACGMGTNDIARAIGCTLPTLHAHFKEELKTGAATKRAQVIDMLFALAEGGNVSAVRKLISLTVGGNLGDPNMKHSSTRNDEDDGNGRQLSTKEGKKQQRQREAEEHDDTFSPPEPPKLVVNNDK